KKKLWSSCIEESRGALEKVNIEINISSVVVILKNLDKRITKVHTEIEKGVDFRRGVTSK
ncbi:hypothetical protein LEP1GSC076_0506, partial [Leptospira sp. Fiocruz LV4135]